MDLRELRVVVAIAEHGSVTRAAAVLHQSPSSVSHALAGLEAELGLALFRRLPRGMEPTDAGAALLAPARRTLHEAELARASVDAVRGVVTGGVEVVAVRTFTVPLADLVAAYLDEHPGVRVRVHHPESEVDVAQLVRTGVCELGLMRVADAPDDLAAVEVAEERTVLVVPSDHRLAGRSSVGMGELDGERIVAPGSGTAARPVFDDLFASHGVTPIVAAEAATHEMVLELVRAGVGATVAPEPSTSSVVGRGASVVVLEGRFTPIVAIVHRRRQDLTPAAAAFVEVARRRRSGA